jgi:hypothetical protein
VHSALFGEYASNVLGVGLSSRLLAISVAFTLLSFPNLTLPAAVLGGTRARAARVPILTRNALLAATGLHLVFALRYNVIDQYMFLLPAYALIAVLAGVGYAVVLETWRVGRTVVAAAGALTVLTPVLYFGTPELARRSHALDGMARDKPYRDDYRYLFLPFGVSETSAARMSREAVELAGPHGLIVVEDEMAVFAVRYQQALRSPTTDVKLVGDRESNPTALAAARDEGRPVVWICARRDGAPPGSFGTWKRTGDLYVLEAMRPRS